MPVLDQANNPRRLVNADDDEGVSLSAYPYSTPLGGVLRWVRSDRLSFPLHGLMVNRYRGESASPLHLGGKNLTCTEIELSMISRSKPLIPNHLRLFLGNGSHPPLRSGPPGDCSPLLRTMATKRWMQSCARSAPHLRAKKGKPYAALIS